MHELSLKFIAESHALKTKVVWAVNCISCEMAKAAYQYSFEAQGRIMKITPDSHAGMNWLKGSPKWSCILAHSNTFKLIPMFSSNWGEGGGLKTRWCQYGHQFRCCKTTESSYFMKIVNFTIIIVVVRYKLVTRVQNLDESIWTQLKIWLEEGVVDIHLLVGSIQSLVSN